LVTNAVRASQRSANPGIPVVQLWMISDQTSIVIHVWDGDDRMPVRRDAMPDEESGRGLMLVESLGKDWGAYKKEEGKVVWVMISLSDDP
jgi:anti-sigma regulatory factor (Ser/Thr protein kinase)